MTTSSARLLLPASTTHRAAPEGSSIATLRARSPETAGHPWKASFRVDLSAPRPTPFMEEFHAGFTPEAFQHALPSSMAAIATPQGLLVVQHRGQRFYCASIHIDADDGAGFRFSITPLISLARAPSAADFDASSVRKALSAVLPIAQAASSNAWQLSQAQIFAHFIDAGWNLPLPSGRGAYALTSHLDPITAPAQTLPKEPWAAASPNESSSDGRCTLTWRATETTTSVVASSPPLSARTQRALDDYAAGMPAASSVLSATSFGDYKGATIAMELASIAAEQRDTHTLQTLRITQQRLVDRGHTRLGVLSALFSAHAILHSPDNAEALIRPLATQLSQDLSWDPVATWFEAQCRTWFTSAPDANPALSSRPEILTTTATARAPKASDVGERTAPDRTPDPSPSPHANASFADAYTAFEQDEDDLAWERTAAAIEAGAPVSDDKIASMILRLVPRYADQPESTAALEAIVRDVSSELHYARAVQLLADHYDGIGALERSNTLLQTGLKRFPHSILLRVSFAQFLSRVGHSAAERAWTYVLEHEGLEPWEKRLYTQERAAARAWKNRDRASNKNDATHHKGSPSARASSHPEDFKRAALTALDILHPPARDAPAAKTEELAAIDQALQQRPSSDDRAIMLARRALLLMHLDAIERAAQSWTGALILRPNSASVLAGIAITHRLQDSERGSKTSRAQFLKAAAQHPSDEADQAQAIEQLRALLR